MNLRENYLAVLHHKSPEFVPTFFTAVHSVGFGAGPGPWFEKGPLGGGADGFGVLWVAPSSGGGAPIPEPGKFVLKDITKWKSEVTFPDVDAFDWEAEAKRELEGCDRSQVVVDYGCGNGVFERLAALMGFEEALCALYIEPEACYDFFTAVTDYKIKVAEKVAKYYRADVFTNYDDVAMERNLFMSPETYRTLIKPHHKRLNDDVRNLGMLPLYHCCGKAEALIEDFIETGAVGWTSVQPCNDIVSLLKNYGDRIAIIGGFDTNGPPGMADAPESAVRAEVRRCMDTYGPYPGYVFFGAKIVDSLDPAEIDKAYFPLIDEAAKYSLKLAGKQ
ncbi:MAG: uroporphyrinogen decarboxylase family protein [Oscillospiraceae bacterium]|jgi:hypothetical protein